MDYKSIQRELAQLGLYTGGIDGVYGNKTVEAVKAFQRLHPPLKVDGVAGPQTQAILFLDNIPERCACISTNIEEIYGKPGSNLIELKLPYKMRLAWDTDIVIDKFQCHYKVHEHLIAIFEETKSKYSTADRRDIGLDLFGGCYNFRNMRGGNRLSLHSWGIAVDIDPARNQLKWGRDKARLAKKDAKLFWEIVGRHCGVSLGQAKNYDWMHFQFASVDY